MGPFGRGAHKVSENADLIIAFSSPTLQVALRKVDRTPVVFTYVATAIAASTTAYGAKLVADSPLGGDRTLKLWVMAEVPSVISWIPDYAGMGATGVSIGSNDLTQLVMGVDRDSEIVAPVFDERDRAVTDAIRAIIEAAHGNGMTCSICGQAPSVYPEYAEFLVRAGIDSISVNPDAIERTRMNVSRAERAVLLDAARRPPAG